jgi:Transglutaminase-like superfamily
VSPVDVLRRPRLLLLGCRMAAWSLAVPILKHALPLPALVRLAWSRPRGVRRPARDREIAQLTWWTSRVQPRRFPDNCLERSLVAYRFLARAGARPRLVTGVGRTGAEIVGHVWVTVDDEPVHDGVDSLRAYKPLVEFGDHGQPIQGEDALARLAGRAAGSFPLS